MHSCKKDNFTTDTFDEGFQSSYRTTVDSETDGLIYLMMYKDFKNIDSNNTLANKFITRLGIPLWNEGLSSDTIFQIGIFPFVDTINQEVTGLLYAIEQEGGMYYNAITSDYLGQLLNTQNLENLSIAELSYIATHNLFSSRIFQSYDTIYTNNYALIDKSLAEVTESRYKWHANVLGCVECWERAIVEGVGVCYRCGMYPSGELARIGTTTIWITSVFIPGKLYWNQGGDNPPPPPDGSGNGGSGNQNDSEEENKKIYETLSKMAVKAVDQANSSFLNKYNLNLTSYELFTKIGKECYNFTYNYMGFVIGASLSEACAMSKLAPHLELSKLKEILDIDNHESNCGEGLTESTTRDIFSTTQWEKVSTFMSDVSDPCEALEYISTMAEIREDEPSIRYDRGTELYDILEEDPNALLTDCSNDYPLTFWDNLLALDIPQSCVDRIEGLKSNNPGWENQPIEDGNAATVNLDYYSITFDKLPNIPGTNTQFPDGKSFFDYFQKKFYSFIDPTVSDFEFLGGAENDKWKWESSDPISSVFTIDIPVLGGWMGSDGSVICSDYNDCCISKGSWVFSTIKAPAFTNLDDWIYGDNDGEHPVAGNRQFGFEANADGTFTLYTKGADRANAITLLSAWSRVGSDQIYSGGDNCWNSLIDGLNNFFENSANNVNVTGTYLNNQNLKPKWQTIQNALIRLGPITDIPCE